jgi:hypothetical protein
MLGYSRNISNTFTTTLAAIQTDRNTDNENN